MFEPHIFLDFICRTSFIFSSLGLHLILYIICLYFATPIVDFSYRMFLSILYYTGRRLDIFVDAIFDIFSQPTSQKIVISFCSSFTVKLYYNFLYKARLYEFININ